MSKTQLISCRIYGVILSFMALNFAATAAFFFLWAAGNLPESLAQLMSQVPLDARTLLGMKALGWMSAALVPLNILFAVFAFKGYLWPVISNTIGWSLLLLPSIYQPSLVPTAFLATLVALTVVAVSARLSDQRHPIAI